ncbi:acetyl-CoA hydrolase/transferase family protein [Jatrophihabitans fulvus]
MTGVRTVDFTHASIDDVDLLDHLRPGDAVHWAQACGEPRTLVELLTRTAVPDGVRAFLGIAVANTLTAQAAARMTVSAYTGSGGNAALHAAGLLDILPVHYSELPRLIADGTIGADVVLLHLPPPDADGRFSLGTNRDHLVAAVRAARVVVAEVHDGVPAVEGGPYLARRDLDVVVPSRYPPVELARTPATDVQNRIGAQVAELVADGATLQFGVGALTDAVLGRLHGHRDLGIHSGMLCDGVVDLVEAGAVTGARKTVDPRVAVAGLLLGSRRIFDFADGNPAVRLLGTSYTHDHSVLAAQHRFTAINSAVEVDLTGQVNAEVAGGRYVGAVGGAMDFLRGAAASRGGAPVVMLPSTARGRTRIVSRLSGPVSTPRSDVRYVVTEHGTADLRGLGLEQRMAAMIEIAAPEHRQALAESAGAVADRHRGAQ